MFSSYLTRQAPLSPTFLSTQRTPQSERCSSTQGTVLTSTRPALRGTCREQVVSHLYLRPSKSAPPSPRSRNDCRSREGGALGKALPAPGAGGIPVWQSGRENHRGFVFTVSTAHSNYCSPPWLLQHYFILDLSHRQSLFITRRGTPRHALSRQRGRAQQDGLPPRRSQGPP